MFCGLRFRIYLEYLHKADKNAVGGGGVLVGRQAHGTMAIIFRSIYILSVPLLLGGWWSYWLGFLNCSKQCILSYTWGSGNHRGIIGIIPDRKRFYTRINLQDFLTWILGTSLLFMIMGWVSDAELEVWGFF